MEAKPGAKKAALKLAVGTLTVYFKDAKNIDYEALKAAAKNKRTAKEMLEARLAIARDKFAI